MPRSNQEMNSFGNYVNENPFLISKQAQKGGKQTRDELQKFQNYHGETLGYEA